MQGAGFGNYNSGIAFSGVSQAQATPGRTMMAASINGQETARMMSPVTTASGGMSKIRNRSGQTADHVMKVSRRHGHLRRKVPTGLSVQKKMYVDLKPLAMIHSFRLIKMC